METEKNHCPPPTSCRFSCTLFSTRHSCDLILYLLLTLLDLPFDAFDTVAAFIHLILCALLQPVLDSSARRPVA